VYLRNGFGQRFSRLGERVGSQWMTYNPLVMQQFHDSALDNAPKVVNALMMVFPSVKRVLDVGAGSGAFARNSCAADVSWLLVSIPSTARNLPPTRCRLPRL